MINIRKNDNKDHHNIINLDIQFAKINQCPKYAMKVIQTNQTIKTLKKVLWYQCIGPNSLYSLKINHIVTKTTAHIAMKITISWKLI